MECPFCKNQIPDQSIFCGHCGKRIEVAKPTLVGAASTNEVDPTAATLSPDCMSETLVDQSAVEMGLVAPLEDPGVEDAGPTAPQPATGASSAPEGPSIQVDPSLEGVETSAEPEGPSLQVQSTQSRQAPVRPTEPAQKIDASKGSAPSAKGKGGKGGKGRKGGFRETMWFMDALDQDALSKIETEDIRDRSDKFKDDGRKIDDEVRREFSLSAPPKKNLGATTFRQARLDLERVEEEARSGGGGLVILLVLLGLGGLLAGAWFLFLKDMI